MIDDMDGFEYTRAANGGIMKRNPQTIFPMKIKLVRK